MIVYEEFISDVTEAVKKINSSITASEDDLLDYVAEEVADRVSVYLNLQPNEDNDYEFDERLVKIVARIVNGVFIQSKSGIGGTVESQVTSVSDNGQSVSFGDKTKNYLASVEDGELFGGFTALLKTYRRCNVVSR